MLWLHIKLLTSVLRVDRGWEHLSYAIDLFVIVNYNLILHARARMSKA